MVFTSALSLGRASSLIYVNIPTVPGEKEACSPKPSSAHAPAFMVSLFRVAKLTIARLTSLFQVSQ